MSYEYSRYRESVFTEDGLRQFLKIRDFCKQMLAQAGAVTAGRAMSAGVGDTWHLMAAVDRLVELGELREVTNARDVSWQHRVFTE